MTVRVAAPSLRRPVFPHVPARVVLIAAVAVAVLAGVWLWARDSSLVAVDRVVISGGADVPAARSALETAAREMTTLDVDLAALRSAAARFSIVRDISVHPALPHTLRITIDERRPVGAIVAGTTRVAVADDGVLLRDTPTGSLPQIIVGVPPGGARVADAATRARVAVLASAPRSILTRILRVTLGSGGLVATLDGGQELRFGDATRLPAKWIAVRRVLVDPAARAAKYLDVRVPERPAAGGLSAVEGGAEVTAATASAPATTSLPATGTPTTTPAAGAPATVPPTTPATTGGAPLSATATPPGTGPQATTAAPAAPASGAVAH